ncbi:MAG TPA: plastocyanin/azurin family copper-binding protein [Candidatus Cybelea sp.]|jgi:plastocyanin|nr:plastocyanin/azurin family copper-binding protein [Candidatus Cybelea sp.]
MTRQTWTTVALLLLAACTAGGIPTSSGGSSGVTIDINLTLSKPVQTQYGLSGGFTPAITTVPVGSQFHFTNTDSFAHTGSFLGSQYTQFPAGSPLTSKDETQFGNTLSGGFSSGALQAGSSSQTITADRAGTYLFGCFFHYGAPMRGAIIAQ